MTSTSLPRRVAPLGVLAALVWAPAPGAAQLPDSIPPRDTTVFRVEGIRVQATRPVTTVGGASAIEVDLDSLALPVAATAEEVLRALPMVHVRTNSRGEAEVTVRGSESRQVAVLFDGVPLTLGWDARTDVSVLPAGAASEVTVVRGLSSILHGPNVLGGVVEMNVGRGDRVRGESRLTASIGGDDRRGFGLTALGSRPFETDGGTGVVRAGVGFRDSPGFPLPGDVSEPVPVERDLRLNTDSRIVNGFLSARYTADGGAWGSLSAASFDAERGIAGELGSDGPRLWRYPEIRRTIVAASGGTGFRDTPLGRGDLEFSVGLDAGSTVIDSYATRAYDEIEGTEEGQGRTVTLRLLADHTLGSRADLRTSLTLADIGHETREDGESTDYRQRLFSLAGETVWRLVDGGWGALDGLRLSAGAAWDRGTTPETGGRPSLGTLDDWGGRVGLSALFRGGDFLAHAGLSRRGRFPSLRESYSEALNRFVPNPDLAPEHLVAFEAGVTSRFGRGEVQVVGFRHDLDGAIRRITLGDGRRQRINSDRLESTGVEILISQTFDDVEVGGDWMMQSVSLTDPGAATSQQPENMPERAGGAWLRLPLPAEAALTAEVEYTGPQFCQDPDSGGDVQLDGGTWLNGVLSRVFRTASGRGVEAQLSATNLADTTLYDQCGLPRPGRLFQLQFRVF
ncbi:MAG: TonB-dependent receptor [Gemmatimonadetes bacterium]|nr:TonB-dependent receptor [Gemmatimonadota bacterium]